MHVFIYQVLSTNRKNTVVIAGLALGKIRVHDTKLLKKVVQLGSMHETKCFSLGMVVMSIRAVSDWVLNVW